MSASSETLSNEYPYHSSEPSYAHAYLWPALVNILRQEAGAASRVFEIGCGNGATANMLSELGCQVTGVDPSESGIRIANGAFPHVQLFGGSTYDSLAARFGTFPIVLSLEVIEHCFFSRKFMKTLFELLEDGGIGVISTPYHGYLKKTGARARWEVGFPFVCVGGGWAHQVLFPIHARGVAP